MLVKNQIGKASECLRAENAALIERVKKLSEAIMNVREGMCCACTGYGKCMTCALEMALEAHGWKE